MSRRLAVALALPVAVALAGSRLGAQQISGVVVSATDSTVVARAEVTTTGGRALARSGADGRFVLRGDAHDTLVVRALGFRRLVLPVAVSGNALRVTLVPLPTVLATVTTTAGQREMRGSEATGSVTIVDRRELDATAAIAANQVLRQLPGLQELSSPPAQTSIAIRGLDAARVLVLVDGEPTAGALIDNRDIGRLSTIAAQRIEVTKGPSSVEFGSDALGGVINLVTAAPTPQFTVDGVVRQGALGRQESTLGVSQTLGKFGYRVNGGWRQVDRVTGYDAAGSTLDRVYDLRTDMRYAASERIAIRADVQGARERQRWPVGGGYNGFVDNLSAQGLLEARSRVAGGELRLRGFAQRFSYQYRQARGDVPIAGSADSLEQRERLMRGLLSYNRAIGRHALDAGVQLSSRTMISPTKVTGDSVSDRVTEFFARDAVELGPVLATLGVRSTNSSMWGGSVNPSIGLAWQATPALRLRGTSARGFRAPGFKEIRYTFLNASGGYTVVGNPDLDPETSWSRAVGVTWAPAARLVLDVEGYRNNLSNLIDTRSQGVNAGGFTVYQNVNVSRARTSGVEGSVRYTAGSLEASLGYDMLRARDLENGLPLDRRATHTARARVSQAWRLLGGAHADMSVRYTGSAPVLGETNGVVGEVARQGALLSVDGQLRLNVTSLAELSLGVNNALNQLPAMYTPAYSRQWFAGLHVRWARD